MCERKMMNDSPWPGTLWARLLPHRAASDDAGWARIWEIRIDGAWCQMKYSTLWDEQIASWRRGELVL